jgi:tetratricopeptide (TPR) repeat protein
MQYFFQIANECFEAGSIRLACSIYQDSLERNPAYARAYRTMGNGLRLLGDLDAAIRAYRNALAIEKNESVHSRLLLALNFHWESSPREIAEEHQRWGKIYFPTLSTAILLRSKSFVGRKSG